MSMSVSKLQKQIFSELFGHDRISWFSTTGFTHETTSKGKLKSKSGVHHDFNLHLAKDGLVLKLRTPVKVAAVPLLCH